MSRKVNHHGRGQWSHLRYHSKRYKKRLWKNLDFMAIGVCHWCRKAILYEEAVFDHEPPLSEGGLKDKGVISCKPCDEKRSKQCTIRHKNNMIV